MKKLKCRNCGKDADPFLKRSVPLNVLPYSFRGNICELCLWSAELSIKINVFHQKTGIPKKLIADLEIERRKAIKGDSL